MLKVEIQISFLVAPGHGMGRPFPPHPSDHHSLILHNNQTKCTIFVFSKFEQTYTCRWTQVSGGGVKKLGRFLRGFWTIHETFPAGGREKNKTEMTSGH